MVDARYSYDLRHRISDGGETKREIKRNKVKGNVKVRERERHSQRKRKNEVERKIKSDKAKDNKVSSISLARLNRYF